MRCRRFLPALLLSLLLHGAAWLLLVAGPRTPHAQVRDEPPIQVTIVDIAPPPPPAQVGAAPKIPIVPKKRAAGAATRSTNGSGGTPHSVNVPSPPAAPAEGSALASGDGPKPLILLPRGASEAVPSEPSRGRTIHPDDPELSEWVRLAEEEMRVHARVDEWADDAAAEGRAQHGVPHPYAGEVGLALRSGLAGADGGTPGELGGANPAEFMFNRWRRGAEDYARSGNPNVAPSGINPRHSEQLKRIFGDEALGLRLRAQAAETLMDLGHGAPLLSLTLELRQGPDGSVRSQRVVEESGSALFDQFVLRVVPEAVRAAGPPPEELLKGRTELRSLWRIEGWSRLPGKLDDLFSLLGSPAVRGVPLEPLIRQLGAQEQFEFRTRLLRLY